MLFIKHILVAFEYDISACVFLFLSYIRCKTKEWYK